MASRAFRIFGSGTSLDLDAVLAHPDIGLHRLSFLAAVRSAVGSGWAGRCMICWRARDALGAGVGAHHLAGLHDLLEAAQVVADLLLRLLAEELGDRAPERAAPAGRTAAPPGPRCRGRRARRRSAPSPQLCTPGPGQRAPGDELSGRSSTISASHSTARPAGPRATQCDRPSSATRTDSRCAMNRGRFSRSRQNRYTSSGGRLTVTAVSVRIIRSRARRARPARTVAIRSSAAMPATRRR